MRKHATKKFSLLALLFLAISIPLAIYSIINLGSFDTRDKAANVTLDVESCQISFPYVTPQSIEVNKTIQATVSAQTPGEAITKVSIMDRTGTEVLKKEYDTGKDQIYEMFTLNPKEVGDFGVLGTLTTDKGTRPCVVENNRTVMVVSNNNAPEFKTIPTSAQPSNIIKVKESYQYLFEATDEEKDTINFAFSFTPDANWLKATVVENGTSGKLSIKFTGIPDKPGSYLANIFIHDGYNAHLRAQTWVINVDQGQNDIPKVSVIKPSTDLTVKKGESVTVSWEGADLNQIVRYELYVATNPGNANTWVAVSKNLSPKIGTYVYDTNNLAEGTYQFVIRAIDNFDPPATGSGFSSKVTITGKGGETPTPGPDDGVVIKEAQIINLSPSNESSIKNRNAIISATLVPGNQALIKKESIKIILDDNDVSGKTRINEGSDNTYTVLYTSEQEFSDGIHKVSVSFEDDKGNKTEKSWIFTILPVDSGSNDTYNIIGFEIPKRLAIIVAAGLAILLLALIVPWLLYLAWRGSKDEDDDATYQTVYQSTIPPRQESNLPQTSQAEELPKPESMPEVQEPVKPIGPQFNIVAPVPITPVEQPVEVEKVVIEPISVEPRPPVADPLPEVPITAGEAQVDIEDTTNKELEALAEKLQAQEEKFSEFLPTPNETAPSSSPEPTSSTPETLQEPEPTNTPDVVPAPETPQKPS